MEQLRSKFAITPLDRNNISRVQQAGLNIPEFATATDAPYFLTEESLRRMSVSPECVTLIAKNGDEIVGFALTSLLPASRVALIHTVAVTPQFRGQGLAVELLGKTLEEIRSKQFETQRIIADIPAGNDAVLNLFRKVGFNLGRQSTSVEMTLGNGKK